MKKISHTLYQQKEPNVFEMDKAQLQEHMDDLKKMLGIDIETGGGGLDAFEDFNSSVKFKDEPQEIGTQYEMKRGPQIISTVRRFVVTKEFYMYQGYNFLVGDIFEEVFNKPNTFINVSWLEQHKENVYFWAITIDIFRINLNNRTKFLFDEERTIDPRYEALQPIEEIDAKESKFFLMNNKKAAKNYKTKLKKIATMNEELTNLRYLLDIKEE